MQADTFEKLFRSLYPSLVRYAQRRINSAELAEDLAARCLEVIWRKNISDPEDDQAQSSLHSLCYRVLDGLIRNAQRSESAYRRTTEGFASLHLVDHREHRDEYNAENGWPVWTQRLSTVDREVLGLTIDGFSVSEIAAILQLTPAAVSMRLQRARARGRQAWLQAQSDEPGPPRLSG